MSIANALPTAAIHSGTPGGRSFASSLEAMLTEFPEDFPYLT